MEFCVKFAIDCPFYKDGQCIESKAKNMREETRQSMSKCKFPRLTRYETGMGEVAVEMMVNGLIHIMQRQKQIIEQNKQILQNQDTIIKQNSEILTNQRDAKRYAAHDHMDLVDKLKTIIQNTNKGR